MSLNQLLAGIKPKTSFEDDNEQVDAPEETGAEETGTDTEETGDEGESEGDDADAGEGEDDTSGEDETDESDDVVESDETDADDAGEDEGESEVGTGEIEPEDADATVPVYESIPTDDETKEIVEMNSSMEAFETELDESDDIEERIVNLNRIQEVTNDSLDNGGLNQDGARLLKITLELIANPQTTSVTTPSVESFGGTHQRRVSTEASGKGIGEIIKSAVVAAGKFLMDLFRRGKAAFLSIFDSKKAIDTKVAKIEKMAGEFKGSPKDVSLSPNEAKVLSVDGKVESGEALVNQYSSFVEQAKKLTSDKEPFNYIKSVTSLKIDTSSDEAFKKSYDSAVKLLNHFPVNSEFGKDVSSEHKEYSDKGFVVKSTGDMFGASELIACSLRGESNGAKEAGMQFIRKNSTKVAETKSIKGISAQGSLKVVAVAKEVNDIIDQAKSNGESLDGVMKDLQTFIKVLEESSSKADTLGSDSKKELKELIAALRKILTSMTVQHLSTSTNIVNATNVMLKVCNASMKDVSEDKTSEDKAVA